MAYASIPILALLIHLIINYDVLKRKKNRETQFYRTLYRYFLFGVMTYYLTDALWGILYETHLVKAAYFDTVVYYIAMAVSVFLWTRYVIHYLNEKNIYITLLSCFGWIYIFFDGACLILNFFIPIKFYFDELGIYHAAITRHIILIMQIFMFFITAIYVFIYALRTNGKERRRHLTIGAFGIAMVLFVIFQALYPLYPLYSIGYLLGTCLIHTFVLEDEKDDYRSEVEFLIKREQIQKKELGSTQRLAYTDSLTGVKNKRAFTEAQKEIEEALTCNLINEFGIVVFDLNGLKTINDTEGHDAGDRYIKESSQIICNTFKHSPIYRIGGDDFVAFLRGEDYANREALLDSFDKTIEENKASGLIVIASGMQTYNPETKDTFIHVFEQADKKMYERKRYLKGIK